MDKFNAGSARLVVVTEGEVDTLSAFQMLDHKGIHVYLTICVTIQEVARCCKGMAQQL